MGTAYASFTSLMHLITDLLEHPQPPIKLDQQHVDSLNSNISFFRRFLEDHHKTVDGGLEIRMADAAHAVEDLIETHIADRVPDIDGSLQRVIDGLDLFRKEVMAEMNLNEQSQGNSRHPAPSQSPCAIFDEDTVVGLEDLTSKIIETLTTTGEDDLWLHRHLQTTAILGMAGIGKTTLARKVYGHPLIKEHFEVVAWVEIPMDSTTEHILIELLVSLREAAENAESLLEESEHELGEKLYDCLAGKKYLVVLDNVHDLQVWADLRIFFPYVVDCRVVITTRELKYLIATHNFDMDLLNEPKSWELFCKKVFGKDSCPSELEDVGKKIARNCGGLPLSISVIGEHLAVSQRTQKYWEHVANNVSSVVFSLHKEESLKRLSTSYTCLPVHLKPCFLYMGIFPEDEEIEVYKLIRLWIAEGFINPISGESLEETAESYFKELTWKSLILPSKYSRKRGTLKGCKIHSLLRHLCIKEAMEKKFFYVALKLEDLRAVENERRIVRRDIESEGGHSLPYYNVSRSRALRTFIFEGELSWLKDKKLLRVLAPVIGSSSSFLLETLDTDQLVNIRYLDPSAPISQDVYRPPSSMFLHCWNLQYLFFNIRIDGEVPLEIWKMLQLRDVKMKEFAVSRPPSESNDILKNLNSAQTLLNFNFSTEAVERIPNVTKLKVRYDDRAAAPDEFLDGVDRLKKLESLGCFFDLSSCLFVRIRKVSFPESLWELNFSHLRWEDVMDKFGPLPNLQVLKLRHCEGSKWELVEGQFLELRFLQLSHCRSLRYFEADDTHFPYLISLVMERLDHLEGINLDIKWLGSIEVYSCPDSAVISAIHSADLQSRLGHNLVEVKVRLLKESALSESLISAADYARVRHIK